MSALSFAAAHAEWLRARVALVEFNAATNLGDADARMDAALGACQAAEWKLLQAPARCLNDIQDRARIVTEMFAVADAAGEPSDNRHRLMLSALVTELLGYMPPLPAKDTGEADCARAVQS
jgi:hypothetical protein